MMRRFPQRSALSCGFLLLAASCGKDTVVDRRTVTLYTFAATSDRPSCTVPNDAFALYAAAGDFQPDPSSPPQASVRLDAISPELSALPATTRQLAIDAQSSDGHWRGFGPVADSGDVGVLLWPIGHDCALSRNVDARPGSTITPYDDRHVLVTGGSGLPSFVVDLSNGSSAQLAGATQEIGVARRDASATAFGVAGGGVLVAGGTSGNRAQSTAEIFDASSGAFTGKSIDLYEARSEHGATLLANGEVLLCGGIADDGGLYSSFELVDVVNARATTVVPVTLATPRRDPTMLTLATGEVMVAGGADADGKPVGTVEYFSADATTATGTASLTASSHMAFVALPAGGALAVVSPDGAGPTEVSVLRPDHVVESAPSIASLPPDSNVRLFAGAGGAPLLWTGSTWLRWSPWTGAFVQFTETATAAGGSSANGPPADVDARVSASPDAGLALWLDDLGFLVGLRFDARGTYSTDVRTLLATDPQSFAPDRLPGDEVRFEAAESGDPGSGLSLAPGASAFLTDATYADFSLSFDTGKMQSPIVVLRAPGGAELTLGVDGSNASCPIADADRIRVTRRGDLVSVATDDGSFSSCGSFAAGQRVSLGLRGRPTPNAVASKARNWVVTRD